jgi:uncharacterized protein with gpF-like domain
MTWWGSIDQAINWLRGRGWVSSADLGLLARRATVDAITQATLFGKSIEEQLGELVQQSIVEGWTPTEWRRETQDRLANLFNHEAETIGRTYLKQAYLNGQDELVADNPVVGELFNVYIWYTTIDGRQRSTHDALNGRMARVGSPLANYMEEEIRKYGCRCSLVRITEDDARSRGWNGD